MIAPSLLLVEMVVEGEPDCRIVVILADIDI